MEVAHAHVLPGLRRPLLVGGGTGLGSARDPLRKFFSPVCAGMSDAAIMELNLPTGIPIVYELDAELKPVKAMSFLGDEETVRKAMEAVAAQGKAKK